MRGRCPIHGDDSRADLTRGGRVPPLAEDLGGGVWSVPVPIPGNPLGYTLVYVLESQRGLVLVDAGWEHTDSWAALTGGLRAMRLDIRDVYGVIVTHHHPDHSGLAGRVREASGAWIAMHSADVAIIRRFRQLGPDNGLRDSQLAALRRVGASEAEVAEAAQAMERHQHIDPPAIPDRELADGDLADLPGRALRVIWTPGHSPGHICLHLADGNRLFTGDHVLPKITPNVGLYDESDADPLSDFLGSLARIAELGASEALPAHEHRFTGVQARAAAIAAHHEERLAEVAAILGDTSAEGGAGSGSRSVSVWEIAARMRWNMPWADMHPLLRRLAAAEAAAHVRLLERRGLARPLQESGRVRYVAAPPAGRGDPRGRAGNRGSGGYQGPDPQEASA